MTATGHTVETQPTDQHIRIEVDGEVVAESRNAVALHETGMPTRWYLPVDDVRAEVLRPSDFHSHCPFKGEASYHHVVTAADKHSDLVWFYPEPIAGVEAIRGRLAFYNEKVTVFVDGEPEA
ncbi:MAG: hypothetical protein QOG68_2634 [Solirubrobacteraceae bacterium]|nr:hypothetical protein [Solirubrobacteraceae bacterium]